MRRLVGGRGRRARVHPRSTAPARRTSAPGSRKLSRSPRRWWSMAVLSEPIDEHPEPVRAPLRGRRPRQAPRRSAESRSRSQRAQPRHRRCSCSTPPARAARARARRGGDRDPRLRRRPPARDGRPCGACAASCASRRSSPSPRPRPRPASAAPSTPAPTRSSSSPSSSRPWRWRSAPSAPASRSCRARCAPASSARPSPTASARFSPTSRRA